MIKKTLNYTDFDGTPVTEELFFNLTQFEATQLAIDLPEEITEKMQNMSAKPSQEELLNVVQSLGSKGIVEFLKLLVVKAYGVREGRGFSKDEKETREFANSMAYQTLMMELVSDPDQANEFINHVFAADVMDKLPTETQALLAANK